ncbi:MAG: hypothetical protein ACNA7J_06300, partial [Wenzhouxiangella sp.]
MTSLETIRPARHIELRRDQLEAGRGIELSDIEGAVRLVAPELKALDVVDSPDLVELDLRECADDLVVRLVCLPRLERLYLPKRGGEHVVHLQVVRMDRHIVIDGPVELFDLDVDHATHLYRCSSAWNGMTVGPADLLRPSGPENRHVVIGQNGIANTIDLDCSNLRSLTVIGGQMEQLRLANAALDHLEITESARLTVLGGDFSAGFS